MAEEDGRIGSGDGYEIETTTNWNMSRSKYFVLFMTLLLVGIGALLVSERRSNLAMRAEMDAFRQNSAAMLEANQRVTEELQVLTQRSEAGQRELMQMRSQAAALRQAQQELARLKGERERSVRQEQAKREVPTDENPFDRHHGAGAGTKVSCAKHLGLGLLMYAVDHDGQFPNGLEQATPLLRDNFLKPELDNIVQQMDQFELLYRGTRQDLDKLPPESTIIVREKSAWVDQQGLWCKAYTMADGSSTIRSSMKDDFEQWERLRIPKPAAP